MENQVELLTKFYNECLKSLIYFSSRYNTENDPADTVMDLYSVILKKVLEGKLYFKNESALKAYVFSSLSKINLNLCRNAQIRIKFRNNWRGIEWENNHTEIRLAFEGVWRYLDQSGMKVRAARQYETFYYRYHVGLSIQETAEVMQISPCTVKENAYKVIKLLRKHFSGKVPCEIE